MRFNLFIVVSSMLFCITSAQNINAVTSMVGEFMSYLEKAATETAVVALATNTALRDPAVTRSIAAWQSNIESIILASGTIPSTHLNAFPTEVRSVYSSVFAAQISIAEKHGFTVAVEGRLGPTAAPQSAAVSTKPVLAAAVAVAGFLGAVALL